MPEVKETITIDNIIDEISNSVTENITNNIKNDYENLRQEVKELKDQNEILINLIEDKQNKTLVEKLKNLFKKDKTV